MKFGDHEIPMDQCATVRGKVIEENKRDKSMLFEASNGKRAFIPSSFVEPYEDGFIMPKWLASAKGF